MGGLGGKRGAESMKRVTQQDIADALGISRLTVSKVFNENPGVRKEMRRLVISKGCEMGYLPAVRMQRTLAPPPPQNPGAVVDLLTYEDNHAGTFWGRVVSGAASALVQHGYSLNVCLLSQNKKTPLILPGNFDRELSRGLLLLGNFTQAQLQRVKQLDLPSVSVDTLPSMGDSGLPMDTVMVSNEKPITEITERLIQNGHREIGFVGETFSCRSFRERWLGFRRTMEKYGLNICAEQCVLRRRGIGLSGQEIHEALKNMERLPTAFVCANDHGALHVIEALQKRNVRVPWDVAVSGFDNTFEASLMGLTSVDSNMEELGQRAAKELYLRILRPEAPFCCVRMETQVVYRASTDKRL